MGRHLIPLAVEGTYIVGLDLSLRAAALCAIPIGWDGANLGRIITCVFGGDLEDPTLKMRMTRMHAIAEGVTRFCREHHVHRVFVEEYAFSKGSTNQATRVHESGGIVKYRLWRKLGLIAEPIVASSARKTLLTKCPQKGAKDFATKNIRRLEGSARDWTEDERDAFCIANHGMMLCGQVAMTFVGEP
jgi:hypothetical protein